MEEKYGSAPIFMSDEKKKAWDDIPPQYKEYIQHHLAEYCSKMQNSMAIEMLCHVINDLNTRIRKLEGWAK